MALPHDYRAYLAHALDAGLVRRVAAPVDPVGELAAIARTVQLEVPERQRYGLLFEQPAGAAFPCAVGSVGFSQRQVEAWIGMPYHDRLEAWSRVLGQPLPVRSIDPAQAPRRDVWQGADASLERLPLPWWSPGQDGGRYHTNGLIITRDPVSGAQNCGIYRFMQLDGQTATLTINPDRGGQHGGMMLRAHIERGERMPVAVAIGCHPIAQMMGGVSLPYRQDELEIAGALLGRPVDVVPCVTAPQLLVPADAEIILEGWVDGIEKSPEGPWGESAGYQEEGVPSNVFHLEAITFRDDATYMCWQANELPFTEAGVVTDTIGEVQLYRHLVHVMRFGGVRDVAIGRAASSIEVVVSARKTYGGYVKQLLTALASYSPAAYKNIIVVDDDIDPHDREEVAWALAYRVQPHRDITILTDLPRVHQDLSTARDNWRGTPTSKLLIDATKKWQYPARTRIDAALLQRVQSDWDRLGLPPLA